MGRDYLFYREYRKKANKDEIINFLRSRRSLLDYHPIQGGAELELKTGTVTRYVVRDSEPKGELVLKAEKVVEKTLPFSPAGLMGELAGKNIVYGVKHNEIREMLANPEDGLYNIRRGRSARGFR